MINRDSLIVNIFHIVNLQLHVVALKKDNYFNLLAGDYPCNYDKDYNEYIYDIGTVQYEQTRNIILNTTISSDFAYYFTYKIGGKSFKSETYTVNNNLSDITINNSVDEHNARYLAVESIRKMINLNRVQDNKGAMEIFNQTISILKELNEFDMINGIIKNFNNNSDIGKPNEGQVYLAVSNMEYFKKWGEFYLDQLSRSLNQQVKPNFKDAGCSFGGEVFTDIVDKASDIFDTLPPPTPSLLNTSYNYSNLNYRSLATRTPVDMSAFNDPGGGCFDINSRINMADGSTKIIKDLKMNDLVMTLTYEGEINMSKVLCVVETIITNKSKKMCKIDDLYITPWHPILYNDVWTFPEHVKPCEMIACNSMATLVLEDNHIVVVNDIPCITLGHNYTYDVLNHSFYGTYAVIEFLQKQKGWKNGYIKFDEHLLEYIRYNNQVIDIKYDTDDDKCYSEKEKYDEDFYNLSI